jgi:hypothetical protein
MLLKQTLLRVSPSRMVLLVPSVMGADTTALPTQRSKLEPSPRNTPASPPVRSPPGTTPTSVTPPRQKLVDSGNVIVLEVPSRMPRTGARPDMEVGTTANPTFSPRNIVLLVPSWIVPTVWTLWKQRASRAAADRDEANRAVTGNGAHRPSSAR